MFAEMTCRCDASLQIDSDEDEAVWSLIWRFTSSHVTCGYVTPGISAEAQTPARKIVSRPGKRHE